MRIIYYNTVGCEDLVSHIDSVLDLNYEQRDLLVNLLWKYDIVVEVKPDSSSRSILKRMSLPFYLIAMAIICFVVCPIKWVVTGYYAFGFKSRFSAFMIKWGEFF